MICFLFSCKKDNAKVENTETLYDLSVSTSVFTQSISDLKGSGNKRAEVSTAPPIIKQLNHLFFLIFDNTGNLVSRFEQNDTLANDFGKYNLKLAKGKYKIIVIGANEIPPNAAKVQTSPMDYFQVYWNDITSVDRIVNKGTQHTFKSEYIEFELSDLIPKFSANIALKRMSTQLDVVIEDAIPNDILYATVLTNWIDKLFINRTNSFCADPFYKNLRDLSSRENFKFNFPFIILEDQVKSPVTIVFYAADGVQRYKLNLNDVSFERNKVTQIKGRFFSTGSNSSGGNFAVSLNGVMDTVYHTFN